MDDGLRLIVGAVRPDSLRQLRVESWGRYVFLTQSVRVHSSQEASIHFSRSLDLLSLYLETAPQMFLRSSPTLETLRSSLAPPLLSLCFLCHWNLWATVRSAEDMGLEARGYQRDQKI